MTFAKFIGNGSTGIIGVINTAVVPVIIAFAFAAFVWGVVDYFFFSNRGDGKQLEEGRYFILWSIIGIVALFSIWGFVNLLLSTLFPTLNITPVA